KGNSVIVKLLLQDKRVDPTSGNNFLLRWAMDENHVEIIDILKCNPRASQPKPLLKISNEEWQKAIDYFKIQPGEIKFSRKKEGTDHSFIKVGDEIYALATRS